LAAGIALSGDKRLRRPKVSATKHSNSGSSSALSWGRAAAAVGGAAGGGEETTAAAKKAFASCLLITPMLECPNRTVVYADGTQRGGSKGQADRDGVTVMSSAQVDWSWAVYAQGGDSSSGEEAGPRLGGCVGSAACSPASASVAQLKAAAFQELVLLSASNDALYDEAEAFATRVAAARVEEKAEKEKEKEKEKGQVHHIRGAGSHLGAPLFDSAAWAEMVATTNGILER
jgi:hypothetical protein